MNNNETTFASQITVLYVEDEPVIRESLLRSLKRRVKTVYVACNGEEGLNLFKTQKPDIVISDIRMPLMDGLQMSREIKTLSPQTPIIITTAFNDEEFFITSIDVGIDTYVKKPIDLKRLTSAIEKSAALLVQQRIIDEKDQIIRKQYSLMRNEMAMAAKLQHSLFPKEDDFKENPHIELSFILKPQSAVSGDFLIIKEKEDDFIAILLCDVMGHGVASGLVTVEIKTVFDTLEELYTSPVQLLEALRRNVTMVQDSDMFYTAVYAVLDYKTAKLSIVSAGGVPFLHYNASEKKAEAIYTDGSFPLGLYDEESPPLSEYQVPFHKGDILLLQTDGLAEAVDKEEKHFDDVMQQIRCCSCITPQINARELVHTLYKDGLEHIGEHNRFEDDVTLIALKKK